MSKQDTCAKKNHSHFWLRVNRTYNYLNILQHTQHKSKPTIHTVGTDVVVLPQCHYQFKPTVIQTKPQIHAISAVLSAINEVGGSMQGCFLQITHLSVGLTINRLTTGIIRAFEGKKKGQMNNIMIIMTEREEKS